MLSVGGSQQDFAQWDICAPVPHLRAPLCSWLFQPRSGSSLEGAASPALSGRAGSSPCSPCKCSQEEEEAQAQPGNSCQCLPRAENAACRAVHPEPQLPFGKPGREQQRLGLLPLSPALLHQSRTLQGPSQLPLQCPLLVRSCSVLPTPCPTTGAAPLTWQPADCALNIHLHDASFEEFSF